MNSNDKIQFAAIMNGVADNFGGQISREGLSMRFEALKDLSIEQLRNSATHLINHRESNYPAVPTVKEFRDALDAITAPQISVQAQAEIQVDHVLERLRTQGCRGVSTFDDEITNLLMSKRWPYKHWAENVLMDELKWWRKEFVVAYLAYAEKEKAEKLSLSFQDSNALEGLTKLIGKSIK